MTSTNQIDTLREALNRSPGWQKIREYTREGKWNMANITSDDVEDAILARRIEIDPEFWTNMDLDPVLDKSMIVKLQSRIAHGQELLIDYKLAESDSFPVGADAGHIDRFNEKYHPVAWVRRPAGFAKGSTTELKRFVGLVQRVARKPGRPVELDDAQPTSFKLDVPSREAIATIRAVRPELTDNSAVIREALRQYAESLPDNWEKALAVVTGDKRGDLGIAEQTIYDAVNALIKYPAVDRRGEDRLQDWLWSGDWDEDETPESVAAEWDKWSADADDE